MSTLRGEKQYEEALTTDQPLSDLTPFFADFESVLEHHTDEMTLKYSPLVNDTKCQGCAQHPSAGRFLFSWRARYHTAEDLRRSAFISMFTIFLGSARHEYSVITFPTYHSLCPDCSRFIRLRNFTGQLVGYVSTWVLWLSLIVLVISLMVECSYVTPRFGSGSTAASGSWREILGTLGIAIAAAGLMYGATRAREIRSKFGVPVGLRKIAKEPFHLISIKRL